MAKIIPIYGAIFTIILPLGLIACASAPPLTDAGSRVRIVTEQQSNLCKFDRVVQYNDRILSMGKDPTVMKAIGETNLRNQVGSIGDNSFVIKKYSSDWFLGTISYVGEAYVCP